VGPCPPGCNCAKARPGPRWARRASRRFPGGYQIDSFFDIYLEVSTDYGVTYQPANSACTVEVKPDPGLVAVAPAAAPAAAHAPMGSNVGPLQAYGNGVIVKEIRHKLFTRVGRPAGLRRHAQPHL